MSIQLAALVFLLTAMRVDAQVYAIGAGSPVSGYKMTILRVDEHRWLAGSVGLVQFRARGGEGTPWIRQTTVQVGTSAFTVRIPAITFIIYSILIVAILLMTFVVVHLPNMPASGQRRLRPLFRLGRRRSGVPERER